jgi:hypothetical protein
MKIMIVLVMSLLISCVARIENQNIENFGKKKISEGIYLKKLLVGGVDRVYFVVDENDKLIGSCSTTNFTVSTGKSSRIESNTFISK